MTKLLRSGVHLLLFNLISFCALSQVTDLPNPSGTEQFGTLVTALENGNYVVLDHMYDLNGVSNVGAVFLYDGKTHELISTLTGSTANDQVGSGLIIPLKNGNFVVRSASWNNGPVTSAGAVTWINGTTGLNGVVSSANSLVGSSTNDMVGSNWIEVLPNDNYIVGSPSWRNGTAAGAGAITLGNGTTGTTGPVSQTNSLVGSTENDYVGRVVVLKNGNFLAQSPSWNNGNVTDAGAVTWCNGSAPVTGAINASNSLVGTATNDRVGIEDITVLANGNYVVSSPRWNNGAASAAGAVTFGNGATGITGAVSSANSLVGSSLGDQVGLDRIIVLKNGNFLVRSRNWDRGSIMDAGAVTWVSAVTGLSGVISSDNSLVGTSAYDGVGEYVPALLANGNYVIGVPGWDNGSLQNAGAATWGNGSTGITGSISQSNSLVGTSANTYVGSTVTELTNGNYVVRSSGWSNGAAVSAGAVTWCSGAGGLAGEVTAQNSLVGSTSYDQVGNQVTPLANGNYVVTSFNWAAGSVQKVGAVTFCDGSQPTSKVVGADNSLVGVLQAEMIGNGGVTALANGNYVVISASWRTGTGYQRGAVTWGSGTTGIAGHITEQNSLVGSRDQDNIGNKGIVALPDGNYLVLSTQWANGTTQYAGAVTYGDGQNGTAGQISQLNSLIGSSANDQIGSHGVTILRNGNYLVRSPYWNNGSTMRVGAVSWGKRNVPLTGIVGPDNSFVGSNAYSTIGIGEPWILANGNFVLNNAYSTTWGDSEKGLVGFSTNENSLGNYGGNYVGVVEVSDNYYYVISRYNLTNPYTYQFRSVTLCNAVTGTSGSPNTCNSVLGNFSTPYANAAYNAKYGYIVVGQPLLNKVSVYDPLGAPLANSLDESNLNIAAEGKAELEIASGCSILGVIASSGPEGIRGTVNSKVWVEDEVPDYKGEPFVARHYQITPESNPGTAEGRVTLYFSQLDFDNFNSHPKSIEKLPTSGSDTQGIINLRIGKFSGVSSDGSGLPGSYPGEAGEVINPEDSDIVWNAAYSRWEVSFFVKGFSGFFVQTNANALPVTLVSFSGSQLENDVILTWNVTDAQNFSHFDVERSVDGKRFSMLQTVPYADQQALYNAVDSDAARYFSGKTLYYRLRMNDIDQTFAYSRMIPVRIAGDRNDVVVYPNPSAGKFAVTVHSTEGELADITVVDILGRVVKRSSARVSAGKVELDAAGLSSGSYTLRIEVQGKIQSRVIVKR